MCNPRCDAVLAACVEGEVATGGARVPLPACDGFGLVTNAASPLACAGREWVNVTTTTLSPSVSAQMAMLGLAVGIAAGACAGRGRRSAAGARDTSVGRDPTAWQHVQPHSQSYDLRPNAAVAMAKSGRAVLQAPRGKAPETDLRESMYERRYQKGKAPSPHLKKACSIARKQGIDMGAWTWRYRMHLGSLYSNVTSHK